MKKIITISREFGSGGRYVGRLLAESLKIPFYDNELIDMLSKKSNYSKDFIKKTEDVKTSSFLYNLSTEGIFMHNPYGAMAPNDKLFIIQNNLIKELAEKGPCVIVGRCSNYILRERDDVLNVFITCDMKHRIERCVKHFGIAEKDAQRELRKKDKARASNFNYYTGSEWGVVKNYDVALNTGTFGVEKCAEILKSLLDCDAQAD